MAIMFGGVFCVTFWTRDGEFTFPDFVASFGSFSGPVVGDMLMLLAALLFGLYEVVYKKLAGVDESVLILFVFIGLIGLWDLLLFAWCPIVSHFFMAPIGDMFGGACVGGFLLQAFLSALFNSIFMVCIYLTSPTIVVGCRRFRASRLYAAGVANLFYDCCAGCGAGHYMGHGYSPSFHC